MNETREKIIVHSLQKFRGKLKNLLGVSEGEEKELFTRTFREYIQKSFPSPVNIT